VTGASVKTAEPSLAYVQVDSVDETVAQARKLGGRILMDKQPIPGMGAFAVLADPTGGVLGVYEASKK
jgi:predicted enzyme related to lactoylglutathione lyase